MYDWKPFAVGGKREMLIEAYEVQGRRPLLDGKSAAASCNESDARSALPPAAEGGMSWSMRVKTSVTIDEKVLRAIDKVTTRNRSRSRVIEDAAREFLARRARTAREARDLEILNASADALNLEMEDVLAYQGDL